MDIPIEIITFAASFLVGVCGAGTYLLLLLMTDRKMEILVNKFMRPLHMTIFYIIAGGLVAGLFNTATGNPIMATSLQNVFMIGFGWQGAIAGVGASGRVKAGREETGDTIGAILQESQ